MTFDVAEYFKREISNWIPAKNDDDPRHITGTVVRVGTMASDYPPPDFVPTIELFDAEDTTKIWRVVGFGAVLYRELTDQRPRPGDTIGLRYDGLATGARGDYPKFRVLVQRADTPEPEIDWDALEREAPEPEDPF